MPMLPSRMRAQPEFSKESKLPHDRPTPFPSRSRRRPTMPSRSKVQSEESKMLMLPAHCPMPIQLTGLRGWPTFAYKAKGTTQQG